MTTPDRPVRSSAGAVALPADDPTLFDLDLDGLASRWADAMGGDPMSAEAMTGADARAQRMGVAGIRLMEHAGTAVAAAARALAVASDRWETGTILVLCGSGNNGGDGFARYFSFRSPSRFSISLQTTPFTESGFVFELAR